MAPEEPEDLRPPGGVEVAQQRARPDQLEGAPDAQVSHLLAAVHRRRPELAGTEVGSAPVDVARRDQGIGPGGAQEPHDAPVSAREVQDGRGRIAIRRGQASLDGCEGRGTHLEIGGRISFEHAVGRGDGGVDAAVSPTDPIEGQAVAGMGRQSGRERYRRCAHTRQNWVPSPTVPSRRSPPSSRARIRLARGTADPSHCGRKQPRGARPTSRRTSHR